jgi:hypothetical protein
LGTQEALRLLERLRQQREALESSYSEIIDDLDGTPIPAKRLELHEWLYGISTRLADYEEMDRDQNTMLMQLLGETIASLVKATSTSRVP